MNLAVVTADECPARDASVVVLSRALPSVLRVVVRGDDQVHGGRQGSGTSRNGGRRVFLAVVSADECSARATAVVEMVVPSPAFSPAVARGDDRYTAKAGLGLTLMEFAP